jgi:hypothetical protein
MTEEQQQEALLLLRLAYHAARCLGNAKDECYETQVLHGLQERMRSLLENVARADG